MKLNKLMIGISAVLMSTTALAAVVGDNAIHQPKDGKTITSTSVDVTFAAATDADGYLIHLINFGTDGACNTAQKTGEYRYFLSAGEAVCFNNSVATIGGGSGDMTGETLDALKLCEWTTPDALSNGNFAIGVTPMAFGQAIVDNNTITAGCSTSDTKALTNGSNEINDFVAAAGVNDNYNQFLVDTGVETPVSEAPSKMVITAPLWSATSPTDKFDATAASELVYKDYSGDAGKANWVEIYVYNHTQGKRIELLDDNLNAKYWYKLGVDVGGKGIVGGGGGTDGGGAYTTYTLGDLDEMTDADVVDGDIVSLWVRGYNDDFSAGPWSDEVRIKE